MFGIPLRFVLPSAATANVVSSSASNCSAGRTSHTKRVLEELRAQLGSDRVDELHASGHAARFDESIGAALDPA